MTKKRKIGVDIDGVLNDQYGFCLKYGVEYCKEIGKYKLENLNVCDTTNMFLWNEDVAHEFWNKYRKKLVVDVEARPFASTVLKKFKEKNYDIYIITARKNNDDWFPDYLQPIVEELTKKWLKDNEIIYDEIYFDVIDKGELCEKKQVDCMIDDMPLNIRKLVNKTIPIIFDTPYNRDSEFDEIIRASDWNDIYNKIMDLMEGK